MSPDPGRIREQLIDVLAQLQRVPRPSAVKTIERTIKALQLQRLVDAYLIEEYGTTDLASLTDDQLHEVFCHVQVLADLAAPRRAPNG